MVMARYQAANRDDEVFDDADEFDLDRSRDHQHSRVRCWTALLRRSGPRPPGTRLGVHHWLGRTSNIELARPFDGPVHEPSFMLFPMVELPIRFTAK